MWNPGSKREWLEEAEIWQSWIMETQRDTENEMPKDTAEKFILHQSFTIRHVVPQAPNPDCVWWGYAWSYKGNRVLFVNSEIIQYIKLPPCPLHSDHLGFQPSLPHFCSISNLNYLWVKGSISLYFGVIRRKTLKLCSKKKNLLSGFSEQVYVLHLNFFRLLQSSIPFLSLVLLETPKLPTRASGNTSGQMAKSEDWALFSAMETEALRLVSEYKNHPDFKWARGQGRESKRVVKDLSNFFILGP